MERSKRTFSYNRRVCVCIQIRYILFLQLITQRPVDRRLEPMFSFLLKVMFFSNNLNFNIFFDHWNKYKTMRFIWYLFKLKITWVRSCQKAAYICLWEFCFTVRENEHKNCYSYRFLSCQENQLFSTQNAGKPSAAGAPPRTPLGELTPLPQTP